jgi:hypothetical protein
VESKSSDTIFALEAYLSPFLVVIDRRLLGRSLLDPYRLNDCFLIPVGFGIGLILLELLEPWRTSCGNKGLIGCLFSSAVMDKTSTLVCEDAILGSKTMFSMTGFEVCENGGGFTLRFA